MTRKADYIDPQKTVLLDEYQKAQELNCSVSWLRQDRMREEPRVPYHKIGSLVRYERLGHVNGTALTNAERN